MPEISRFYGIIIAMFYKEHNPPHFHVRYGEYSAEIGIEDFALKNGYLPPRTLGLVVEWAMIHKTELETDWDMIERGEQPKGIEPLE